jgi:hypothetical protein
MMNFASLRGEGLRLLRISRTLGKCHPIELCSNWVTAEEQIARVAIWMGININWSKRTGRLQLATISRET